MKLFRLTTLFIMCLFAASLSADAQNGKYDVFVPISKYITQGDAEKLSAWFDENLEVGIITKTSNSSRSQAKQIVKSFFDTNSPRSFEITHTTGSGNKKYAIGNLNAGGGSYVVTIFINFDGKSYKIQQLKIDPSQ